MDDTVAPSPLHTPARRTSTCSLPLHRAGFQFAFQSPMLLDFDRADFGEAQPLILSHAETALGKGETLIAPVALKSRIARRFSFFHTPKERLVCLVYPAQHILQNLRVDVLVQRFDLFDLGKLGGLLIVADAHLAHAVRIPALLDGGIVQFPCPVQCPLQFFSLFLRRVQAILVGFQFRHVSDPQ